MYLGINYKRNKVTPYELLEWHKTISLFFRAIEAAQMKENGIHFKVVGT